MFHLGGKYEVARASLYTLERKIREAKTIEWLGRPGGEWKNGWYEDMQGQRWYSGLQSTNPFNSDGIAARQFDMLGKREMDCKTKNGCPPQVTVIKWGDQTC